MADTVAHSFRRCKFQVFRAGAQLGLVRPVETIVPSIAKRASVHAFPIPASKFHPRAIFELLSIKILIFHDLLCRSRFVYSLQPSTAFSQFSWNLAQYSASSSSWSRQSGTPSQTRFRGMQLPMLHRKPSHVDSTDFLDPSE